MLVLNNMPDLDTLRKEIDTLDYSLIKILRDRLDLVKKIGKIKKSLSLPSLDNNRWQEVIKSRLLFSKEIGLDVHFVEKILNLIHVQAIEIEDYEKRI